MSSHDYLPLICSLAALTGSLSAFGQEISASHAPQIQDNSFLIEEAYNQERGGVQHISTFARMWNCKDWSFTFTQEWPGAKNWRHQYSYTITDLHTGAFSQSGSGIGDVILNYRYQAIGSGEERVAFSPRISLMPPTGKVERGRGTGGAGLQTNLPLSVVVHGRLVTHRNAGGTFVPQAHNADQMRAIRWDTTWDRVSLRSCIHG